jgi:hypothetical protein
MPHQSEHPSTLLLDRPAGRRRSLPVVDTGPARATGLAADASVAGPSTAGPSTARPSADRPTLPSPAMALLATIAILEGYKWIGAIPTSDSRLSLLVFGRGGAAVFAVVATAVCLALTRVGPGEHRPASQKLVLLATVAVMASSIVLLSGHDTMGKDAFGVADLALASTLAGAIIVGQRRQRAQRPIHVRRDGSGDHALPVT